MPPTQTMFSFSGSTAIVLSYQPWLNDWLVAPGRHSLKKAKYGLVKSEAFSLFELPSLTLAQLPGSPPLFGSHPIWFGAIAAVTWLYRDQQISLFGMLAMSARRFLLLLLGMSVLMFLASKNHIQLVADLGAVAGGVGFVRWMKRPRSPRAARKPSSRARGFKVIRGGGGAEGGDDRPKWLN